MKTEVRFSEWFEKGFNLYKENIGLLILASLIAVILSAVTAGILMGPMLAGLIYIVLGCLDNRLPKPEVGNVFKGFNYFLNSFLFILVWGLVTVILSIVLHVIPILGQLLSFLAGFVVQALIMFGMFLIVDSEHNCWPASRKSYEIVKTNFWPFLGFSAVAGILGGLGAILCGIGVAVTLPIQVCIIGVAYREIFGTPNGEFAIDE